MRNTQCDGKVCTPGHSDTGEGGAFKNLGSELVPMKAWQQPARGDHVWMTAFWQGVAACDLPDSRRVCLYSQAASFLRRSVSS